ncbi:hypothetical protein AAIH70_05315 [Neorhizobium sp. BT27B]|uniref:hypothetical protein n=1 Tax=Neorhizobium sp. BT27B TaxID=3142625 RepID=UPI003D2D7DE3
MTYQQKVEEVRALAQAPEPNAAHHPMLSVEIGITAPSLAEVAAVVLAAYQQWQQIGAAIGATRLGAKAAISLATSSEEAEVAYSSIHWP